MRRRCQYGVCKEFLRCLEGAYIVSGKSFEGVLKISAKCLKDVLQVSGRKVEGVLKVHGRSGSCLFVIFSFAKNESNIMLLCGLCLASVQTIKMKNIICTAVTRTTH